MKKSKLIAIWVVSMFVAVFFMSLTPVGAQNTSTSQADFGGQSSGQLTMAPLNPAWLAYEQNRTAEKAIITTTATGNSLGHIPSPVDFSYLKGKRAAGAAQTYAPSYDLRTVGKVTSVKNQGPHNTCWTFSAFGSLESYLLPAETRNFSEYNLVTQSGFDRAWDGKETGNRMMSTAYLARWGGPVNEVDDPYPGGDAQLAINNAYTIQKHTQNVYFLPDRNSSTDNDNIKWGLTTYGGLEIVLYWDDAYYSTSPATYYYSSTTSLNHLVTLVGWDDNYAATNFRGTAGAPPGNGAFIAKNSWGTSWGDGGYFYLSYYDTSLGDATAYTAEPASNYFAVYQYDPLGWVKNVGYESTTAWQANVFTADSSAKPLTAVSFYTNDVNTQYEVYIYTDPTSGPIGGTQHVGPKGTMPLVGYHTVKLASPVPLSSGQQFSVVVKFTTSGYPYPLAYECALSGYSSGATTSSGQSYGSHYGSTWTDITTFDSTSNFCIKAFTSAFSNLYYPDFTDTANPDSWRSWLVMQNPTEAIANVTLSIRSRSGDMLFDGNTSIPPYGVSAIRPRNLVGADCSGSVVVSSDQTIMGTCQITRNSNEMCMSYNAFDQGSTTLYYPDFTDTTNPNSWRSWLVIQNPTASAANITLEIRSRAGDLLYTGAQVIPANGVSAIRPRNLVGSDCAGSAVVTSDQPIMGTCQITRNNNLMCMSYSAFG